MKKPAAVYTIGHSTRPLEVFIALLEKNNIDLLVDVRTVPRSRHNPQYNQESLPDNLKTAGIAYVHLPGLGGLRQPRPDSPNTGWRNASFRGYADYMQTEEFARNLEELIVLAADKRASLMCAEAVPWRCHRSLIADALTLRGIKVMDIISENSVREHALTPWAVIDAGILSYPPAGVARTA